ncbi:MAG TPA: pantoate--beta-alanine ligase [Pirellulaceae bacterium]|nr:pantoate--beta-alanine ligase [Pirellulaceae bacterium]
MGLGSNLGERVGSLTNALVRLRADPHVRVLRSSSLLETRPVGGPEGQPRFLNAAAVLETDLPAEQLLERLLAIERELGRMRGEQWGPRTIDLDLLLYDGQVINTASLTVPHPRLAERRFVLEPAAEIARELRDPASGLSIGELLERLGPPACGEMGLRIYLEPRAMRRAAESLRREGKRISLVPTMGALHEGHLSLVREARQRSDVVIATIFVNPTQFGPQEDFSRYPRTLEGDLRALADHGCDLAFVPEQSAMYPAGFSTYIEPPAVAQPLEGVCRPGHFRGVATIVLKLFQIVPADIALFGQKDYQQSLVIRRMALDLNVPIEIATCPTVREPDGLAQSSRNRYLSPAERQQALALSRSLDLAERLVKSGERGTAAIVEQMRAELRTAGIERIDYVSVADPETLVEQTRIVLPAVALVAAYAGTTRLIDNRIL